MKKNLINITDNLFFVIAYNDLFVFNMYGDFSFLDKEERYNMTFSLCIERFNNKFLR